MDTPTPSTEAPTATAPAPAAPPEATAEPHSSELTELRAKVEELHRERDHLVAVVDILQAISGAAHFSDIVQTIARKLGETFGLDRASIFLTGNSEEVRLVASYENPSIRNLVVDLARYPELQRVFNSGETVVITDAMDDPMFRDIKPLLDLRNVRSIVVAPIRWRAQVIGAIFVRTERGAAQLSESDIRFLQVVASLTAKALRAVHRFEAMVRATQDATSAQRKGELQRIALVAFLQRLMDQFTTSTDFAWAETLLPKQSDEEIRRLVSVAIQVIDEESKG